MFDFKVRSLAESFLGGGTMKDNLLLHWEISPKVKNEITKTNGPHLDIGLHQLHQGIS